MQGRVSVAIELSDEERAFLQAQVRRWVDPLHGRLVDLRNML